MSENSPPDIKWHLDPDELAWADADRVEQYAGQPITDLLTLHRPLARLTMGIIALQIEHRDGCSWEDALQMAGNERIDSVRWVGGIPTQPGEAEPSTGEPSPSSDDETSAATSSE